MAEKRTRQLPPLRVDERLETGLLRLAARDDRAMSDYIRRVLEKHVFGHDSIFGDLEDEDENDRASQRDARNGGGRRRRD